MRCFASRKAWKALVSSARVWDDGVRFDRFAVSFHTCGQNAFAELIEHFASDKLKHFVGFSTENHDWFPENAGHLYLRFLLHSVNRHVKDVAGFSDCFTHRDLFVQETIADNVEAGLQLSDFLGFHKICGCCAGLELERFSLQVQWLPRLRLLFRFRLNDWNAFLFD